MAFTLGEQVFYTYVKSEMTSQFGPAGVGLVTGVLPDGSCNLIVFSNGCDYGIAHTGVTEGTGPGQASSTPPALAAADQPPGGNGGQKPQRPPQK